MAKVDIDSIIRERKRRGRRCVALFTTYQEFISKRLPLPYAAQWIIFGQLLYLIHFLLRLLAGRGSDFSTFVAFLCLMIGYWNALVIFMSKKLENFCDSLKYFVDLPDPDIEDWYVKRVRRMFSRAPFLFFLVAIGLPIIVGLPVVTDFFSLPTLWFSSTIQKLYFLFLWILFGFLASKHCALSSGLVFLTRDISFLPLKLGLDLESSKSVRTIASLFFAFSLHYVALTCLAFGMIIYSPFQLSVLATFCMAFSALFLMFVFVGPQWYIHRVMLSEKRERVRKFNGHFEEIVARIEQSPTEQNFRTFESLLNFRNKLTQMPEWPFNIQMFLGILGAIIIPILILILELLLRK